MPQHIYTHNKSHVIIIITNRMDYNGRQSAICQPKIPNDRSFFFWPDILTDQGIKIKNKESIHFVYDYDLKIMFVTLFSKEYWNMD